MIRHFARTLHKTIFLLNYESIQTTRQEKIRGADALLNETERKACRKIIECVLNQHRALEIEGLDRLAGSLQTEEETIGLAEYRGRLLSFRNLIEYAADKRTFAYIPKDRMKYFEDQYPFGKRVATRFPKANAEACHASNCMAADLPTGAVLYLMRSAEYGMRALATERGVEIKNVDSIEFADWGQLLSALEKKREAVNSEHRGKAKELALEFYGGAIGRLQGFKDVYRNRASHARGEFSWNAASDAFVNVRGFMELLATYIREGNKQVVAWDSIAAIATTSE
jgi:hypothetical protein